MQAKKFTASIKKGEQPEAIKRERLRVLLRREARHRGANLGGDSPGQQGQPEKDISQKRQCGQKGAPLRHTSRTLHVVLFSTLVTLFLSPFGACTAAAILPTTPTTAVRSNDLRMTLLAPSQVTFDTLKQKKREGVTGIVLNLTRNEGRASRLAAGRVKQAGLELYYWIEVARCPEIADAHPEWMASLQGHPEWRQQFPGTPPPAAGEVVKNYPWVPIRYRESFDAHLRRVEGLVRSLPTARGIFLNDLQAAPSSCGCGNTFCRWVPDYGPIRTATTLPPDAAAQFVSAVQKLSPKSEIVPVWTTECEENEEMACHGVPCFTGACWYAYTEQLMPVAKVSPTLAALVPFRAFGRDTPRYGPTAGWVRYALATFAQMPPKRKGEAIPAGRIVAVLQGWNVTPQERQAQIRQAREAGAKGYVMAESEIPQGWEPRILRTPLKPSVRAATPEHLTEHTPEHHKKP